MFEISIPRIREGIQELKDQEQELLKLVQRLERVCADFDGLVEDKSDKQALGLLTDEVNQERQGMAQMVQTLMEIRKCYEETEAGLAESKAASSVGNQFGLLDLSGIGQMLDSLNIILK